MDRQMISYTILDPTGNVTALVESPVDIPGQPAAAALIMQEHPEVEQVGFVRFFHPPKDSVHAELRMAGGEFCGNASMCAAALYLFRMACPRDPDHSSDPPVPSVPHPAAGKAVSGRTDTVLLEVSGADDPVEVCLTEQASGIFDAGIRMPAVQFSGDVLFSFSGTRAMLPLMHMKGISHLIIDPESPFSFLQEDRNAAEQAVRDWCRLLSADGLGLMFLDGTVPDLRLAPLVYIPGSGTIFWENSCASGSAAAGMFLAQKASEPVRFSFREPGGTLCVETLPGDDRPWLFGKVRLLQSSAIPFPCVSPDSIL